MFYTWREGAGGRAGAQLTAVTFLLAQQILNINNNLGTGYDWPWVLGFDLAKIFWSMP